MSNQSDTAAGSTMEDLAHLVMNNQSNSSTNELVLDLSGWLLMGSAYPMAAILVAYLSFVLVFGPRWMRARNPYNLQPVILVYNAFQVLFNGWLLLTFMSLGAGSYLTKSWCEALNTTSYTALAARLLHLCWWYFFCKVVELLDTVFFVLRKKQNQVTFLHVYHHSSMVLYVWGYLKYNQGEQAMVVGILNCFIHVVMYSYYLLAALGPKYQKYLWWKKYMTLMQLVQFGLALVYNTLIVTNNCPLSHTLSYFYIIHAIVFFILFLSFYKSAYKTKSSKAVIKMKKFDNDCIINNNKNIDTKLNGYQGHQKAA